jgi:hypothetical protein
MTESDDDRAPANVEERIRGRAYELFLARGATDGADLDDWLAAEREIRVSAAPTQAAVEARKPRRHNGRASRSPRPGSGEPPLEGGFV